LWEFDLTRDNFFGLGHITADIAAGHVHIHITREKTVFIPDH